jgi:death-on-curing protein
MDEPGRQVVFLTEDEVLEVNRRMILEFGGIYFEGDRNLANPGSLRYMLEAIQGSVYEHIAYPTVFDKAAALAWEIIRAHVFHDGNKRTGMETCRLLLEINGWDLTVDAEIVSIALQAESGELSIAGLAQWLAGKSRRAGLS